MTGTTSTTATLRCSAELQEMTVETGLDFLGGEQQWLKFEHNAIIMKGWLTDYNSVTGLLKAMIEYYTGGGGSSYTNWTITTADNMAYTATQYLATLKSTGVILDGTLVSADEGVGSAIAKASFIVGEEIKQKFIVIYKALDALTWKFYTPADVITTYTYSPTGWHYEAFAKRIVAPIQLTMQYPAIEVWFRLNGLPIIVDTTTVYLYCNVILPEHQALIDSLVGVVTVEERP